MTTASRRPLTSRDPARLGDRRLLARLGEGGQGVVYLAEDPSGRQVAVKVLHDRGGSPEPFLKEIASARRVASFCTARVLEVGEDEGLPYVVTEFIDGPSLRLSVEENGPQSGSALYRLAIGTATALAAIHQAGVVHRDFKPGNVLIGPDGPRVIDFGVARSIDATATASSSVLGTPSYMAPEQLAGQVVGPAADVFAWAATIAYAANGRPPYGQDSIPAVMNRIVTGKPDLGCLSGALRDLVTQALHKDPGKRPQSRDILLRLLEHSEGPIAAPQALAQGHALATADDETLTYQRTARWTAAPLPKRTVPYRRALLSVLLGGTVLVTCSSALALDRPPGVPMSAARSTAPSVPASVEPAPAKTRQPRTVKAAPAAAPTTPGGIADAVERAVGLRRTASFSADGAMTQSNDAFAAKGRLHFRPGSSTNYDLTVRNPYGDEITGDSAEARVILLGNCGHLRDDPKTCHPVGSPLDREDDPHIWMSAEVRWVTSPYNVLALLRNSTSLKRGTDAGTTTYQGTAPGAPLAASGPVASFYKSFGGRVTKVTYTLVTTREHLPKRLDIDLWTRIAPKVVYHSLYSATYRGWGSSGTITRAY